MRKGNSISVVIPSFNAGDFMESALQSVFDQRVRPDEIILVDDGSTDGTPERVRAISSPIPLRIIELGKNSGGPALPLNVGIEEAKGNLISILDQDDLYFPHKIENQLQLLFRHPEISCVFSPPKDYPIAHLLELPEAVASVIPGDRMLEALLTRGNFVVGFPAMLFRKEAWRRRGGFDESFKIAADYEFLCWLSTMEDLLLSPVPVYERRVHSNNHSSQRSCSWETSRVRRRYLRSLKPEKRTFKLTQTIFRRYASETLRHLISP